MFKSRKVLTLVLLGLCLVGLADSAYLTWDHGSHKADPIGFEGGLCGADGGCAVSRSSPLSEVPLPGTPLDLPISLLALGFYVVFMVLVALDHRGRAKVEGANATSRLLFALALLSVVYSAVLLGYSLYVGSLCKFCVVLYVVNLGLLWATWKSLGETFGSFFSAVWGAVFSRPALVAAIAMATVVGSGYLVYRGAVSGARAETEARMRAGASQVSETDRPMKGPANAKVQIVEYADFECPHCKIAFTTLEALVKDRPEVSVQFKHFPLDQACNPLIDRPFHQRACELAALTECAHRQGAFWEAAALMFDAEQTSRDDLIAAIAKAAKSKVDTAELARCATSPEALAAVRGDIDKGIALKIRGTPTVFLNGVQIGGAVPRHELDRLIDEVLGKKP